MIATSTKWGSPVTGRRVKVRGLVSRPGSSDHVEIVVDGSQAALGGEMLWMFEACGVAGMSVRSLFTFRTQRAAQDAAEVFAQHLLDFTARLPRPTVPKVKAG